MDSVKIMRWVQVGILVFLMIAAGLLFAIWRQHHDPPAITLVSEPTAKVGITEQASQPKIENPSPPTAMNETAKKPDGTVSHRVESPISRAPGKVKTKPSTSSRKNSPQTVPAVETATKVTPPLSWQASKIEPPPPILPPPQDPKDSTNSAGMVEKVPEPPPIKVTIPPGTSLVVRLMDTLSSDRNQAGDPFTATLDNPLLENGLLIADRGATITGRVLEVRQAGRVSGVSRMFLDLTHLQTVSGNLEIATETLDQEAKDTKKKDAKTVAALAGIGAVIGAIAGGGKGAAIGAATGGGAGAGTVLVTRGSPAQLERETLLTFILKEPLSLSVNHQPAASKSPRERKRLDDRY